MKKELLKFGAWFVVYAAALYSATFCDSKFELAVYTTLAAVGGVVLFGVVKKMSELVYEQEAVRFHEAFTRGCQDRLDFSTCPYEEGSVDAERWRAGYATKDMELRKPKWPYR